MCERSYVTLHYITLRYVYSVNRPFFALQFFVSLMCHIKSVCVTSIDLVVAFSSRTCMSECTCLFTFPMQIPKASLCIESISQKSYALVGLREIAILTSADSKEGTACYDFLRQA